MQIRTKTFRHPDDRYVGLAPRGSAPTLVKFVLSILAPILRARLILKRHKFHQRGRFEKINNVSTNKKKLGLMKVKPLRRLHYGLMVYISTKQHIKHSSDTRKCVCEMKNSKEGRPQDANGGRRLTIMNKTTIMNIILNYKKTKSFQS